MGLPLSREPLPNGPGSIVPSTTILAMEDCIIGKKHNAVRRWVSLTPFYNDASNTWQTAPPATNASTGSIKSTTIGGVTASLWLPPWEVGDEILGLEIWKSGDGSSGTKAITAGLFFTSSAGISGPNICNATSTTVAGGSIPAPALFAPTVNQTHVMQAGEQLFLSISNQTTVGFVITSMFLVYRRT